MSKQTPDYQDADIILRLYDLRRETVMRSSRELINGKFFPATYEEFAAVGQPDHPLNAAFRQVTSYWEMVFGLARHGIVNAEFLVENNGEGLFVYSKVAPFIEKYRADFYPGAFQNAEWVVANTKGGKERFEMMRKRIEQMAAKKEQ